MSAEILNPEGAVRQPGTNDGPSINPTKVLAALFGAFFLSVLIVFIGLAVGVRDGDFACLLWGALAVNTAFIPLALDYGRAPQHRHLFLSMLSIAYTVNFVVPVFSNYIPAVGPMDPAAMQGVNLLPEDIARGQWIAMLGLICFFVGYGIPIRVVMHSALPAKGYEWSQYPALVATGMLMFIGWIFYIASAAGLIPASAGTGWQGAVASATISGSALLTATYLKYRSTLARNLLVILVPITTAVNFMTGSKTAALMPAAMVVMTWVIVQRTIRIRWVLAGVLAITMLYPVAQFWRTDILQKNTLTLIDVARDPVPALQRTGLFLSSTRAGDYFGAGFEATGRRLDAIGISSVIIRDTPSVSPFQNGRTLALIPIAFIPRILWPGKPIIPIGAWISQTYTPYGYLTDTNLAATWIGEFYLNFGLLGVAVGMFVMGLILRLIHESLLRRNATIPMISVSVILITALMMGIQEAVARTITTPALTVLPIFLMHIFMRLMGGVHRSSLDEPEPTLGPIARGPRPSMPDYT